MKELTLEDVKRVSEIMRKDQIDMQKSAVIDPKAMSLLSNAMVECGVTLDEVANSFKMLKSSDSWIKRLHKAGESLSKVLRSTKPRWWQIRKLYEYYRIGKMIK